MRRTINLKEKKQRYMSLKLWHFIRVAKKVSIVIYCGGVVALTEDNETDFFSCLVEIFHFNYL